MKCPACPDTVLSMSNREGIEIDYCPKCRGVWLDRGELDKIIERTTAADRAVSPPPQYPPSHARPEQTHSPQRDYSRDGYRHDDDDDYRKRHYKKRGGLLGDLFDF
jgi:Zn-finger nucleic acid-binding protein